MSAVKEGGKGAKGNSKAKGRLASASSRQARLTRTGKSTFKNARVLRSLPNAPF